MEFINYKKLQSYTQAIVYFICGGRDVGKTFGARKAAIENYFTQREKGRLGCFCEITRFKDSKGDIERDYFTKLQLKGFFTEYEFKWENHAAYFRISDSDDEWQLIGYCVALTEYIDIKKQTFIGLEYGFIIFDEAIIESNDRYHRYLANEFDNYFLSVLSSLLREDVENVGGTKIFLLGNSVDLLCPYFEAFGITFNMLSNYGIYWVHNKTVLFWNVEPRFTDEEINKTIVGRLGVNAATKNMIFNNEFVTNNDEFICEKPKYARVIGGIVFNGRKFSIWIFGKSLFVSSKMPNNLHIFTLLYDDGSINYTALRRNSTLMDAVKRAYFNNSIWYDTPKTREGFYPILRFIGIR
jgi:hypothetical protein